MHREDELTKVLELSIETYKQELEWTKQLEEVLRISEIEERKQTATKINISEMSEEEQLALALEISKEDVKKSERIPNVERNLRDYKANLEDFRVIPTGGSFGNLQKFKNNKCLFLAMTNGLPKEKQAEAFSELITFVDDINKFLKIQAAGRNLIEEDYKIFCRWMEGDIDHCEIAVIILSEILQSKIVVVDVNGNAREIGDEWFNKIYIFNDGKMGMGSHYSGLQRLY